MKTGSAVIALLIFCFAILTNVTAANDNRIEQELSSAPTQIPLKTTLGEEMFNKVMTSGEYEYVGNDKCRLCHREFFLGRKQDRHDFAMDVLTEKGHKENPKCLVCHSTGYGVNTGFVSIKETPRLANVQCEGCHGPGNVHVKLQKARKSGGFLVGKDHPERIKKMCKSCHTERWSRSFDELEHSYVKYRKPKPK